MANTQTTVPIFVAAQVLEANQLNQSAATGVPVFATTVTRDAGFGGAGEKPLAEGQLCYLESTNVVQYYDGAAWATVGPTAPAAAGALTFVGGGALSSTSTTFSSVFSATYDAYRIHCFGLKGNTGQPIFTFKLGSATSAYSYGQMYLAVGGTWTSKGAGPTSSFCIGQGDGTEIKNAVIDLVAPFLSTRTSYFALASGYSESDMTAGKLDADTSFTDFTISNSTGATQSGTIKIYGYSTS